MEQDEAKKAELVKKFSEETLPNFLQHFSKALEKNGGKYLVGDAVTLADIGFANVMMELGGSIGDAWREKCPQIAKFTDDIMGLPNIKKWLESRPKTAM